MTLLLDTGAVYAYYDGDDTWHPAMLAEIDAEPGPLVLPAVVIPEVDHLLGARIGQAAQLALYTDITDGIYLVVDLEQERYRRVLELNRRFSDLRFGFVDAAVAALSEQLGVRRVATTDRRHFPAIGAAVPLELVPANPVP
ncbi:MAG: type II toxin-antitoxin system VapC family toxin [Pseudonocardia sp.]